MNRKKANKLTSSEEHSKLIRLLVDETPEERQKLFTDIDGILCHMLDLEPDDLPWINPNQHTEKWEKLMKNLRLVVGKLEFESYQKNRTVH
jgi:transcription termination factor Rho